VVQCVQDKRSTVLALSRTLCAGSAGATASAQRHPLTAAARGALPGGRSGHSVIAEAGACSISASVVTNRSTTMEQQYVRTARVGVSSGRLECMGVASGSRLELDLADVGGKASAATHLVMVGAATRPTA